MNTHKSSILSKNPGFWFQLKNLFFKGHGHIDQFRPGGVNPFTLSPYVNKAQSQVAHQWQVQNNLPKNNFTKDAQKLRNNWSKFITSEIGSHNYTPGEGLSAITLDVKNETTVNIDYIQVKVLYLEENGKLYKSEYTELFNVSPLSTQKVPVYSSPYGSTLQVRITNVVASAIDLAFSRDSYE